MLSQLLADHAALHQARGFKFRTPGILLRNFVAFASIAVSMSSRRRSCRSGRYSRRHVPWRRSVAALSCD